MAQTLDNNSIMMMSLFEQVSKSKVKDCFELSPKSLVFVVQPGQLAKAVGKKGSNVKKLEAMFRKTIRIIEYDPKIEKFLENLCLPNKIVKVDFSEQMLWDNTKRAAVITPANLKSRGFIIGKDASNLRLMESITRRYFQIDEIRVTPADKVEDGKEEVGDFLEIDVDEENLDEDTTTTEPKKVEAPKDKKTKPAETPEVIDEEELMEESSK